MENVYKSYGRIKALNGLSIEVGKGITGLIGPNGAGKTTTIKIALGLLRPDKGIVKIYGMNPWDLDYEAKSKIGVAHENISFPGNIVVKDYLKFVARLRGLSDVDKHVKEILKFVGLDRHEYRRIGELSAGMKQKLNLAQALIGYPEFVILDEPDSGLDVEGIKTLSLFIKELSEKVKDIDKKSLKRYLITAEKSGRLPDTSGLTTREILDKLRLLEKGKLKRAAIILFAKDPNKFYPNITVLQMALQQVFYFNIENSQMKYLLF